MYIYIYIYVAVQLHGCCDMVGMHCSEFDENQWKTIHL